MGDCPLCQDKLKKLEKKITKLKEKIEELEHSRTMFRSTQKTYEELSSTGKVKRKTAYMSAFSSVEEVIHDEIKKIKVRPASNS